MSAESKGDVDTRFWSKAKLAGDDECWLWQRAKLKGYGLFRANGRLHRAHRFAYELTNGPIPDGLDCLHRCDTPSCVNPRHLFLGTHQQNMQDRDKKGRAARLSGESHGGHKLTTAQVEEVKSLYDSGAWSQRALAAKFGVCQRTVTCIVNGLSRLRG